MIGVYDSGLGGLTVLKRLRERLPDREIVYLGDSGRAPYGGRDSHTLLDFAEQCVQRLFEEGCRLVVVACNTIGLSGSTGRGAGGVHSEDWPMSSEGHPTAGGEGTRRQGRTAMGSNMFRLRTRGLADGRPRSHGYGEGTAPMTPKPPDDARFSPAAKDLSPGAQTPLLPEFLCVEAAAARLSLSPTALRARCRRAARREGRHIAAHLGGGMCRRIS